MRSRRLFDWYLPAALAAVAGTVLAGGFAVALGGRFGQPMAPLARPAAANVRGGAYRILALGDSITDGTGDPGGRGYANRVNEALRARGVITIFTNLAVGGAETEDLLEVLKKDEARRQLAAADLVLVSAGGNDLSHSLRAAAGEPEKEPEAALGRARDNLAQIVRRLREANREVSIRLIGLYNPFEIEAADAPKARAQLAEWNTAIEQATQAYTDVLFIPVADLFAERSDRLAGDRYHPGPRGHALIAERVLQTLPVADPPGR